MSEIYDDYLARKMSRAEHKLLTDDDKRERINAQKRISTRKYNEKYPEKIKENNKKFRENNPEYDKKYNKEYNQTPTGKKSIRISKWKCSGLQESDEDLEWIYDLYLHQELCYSCDVKMTRGVINCPNQACLDHSHITHRFRQICCRACNSNDHWMTYWC